MTVYRGLYGEGMGGRTGVGAANYIWDVQHPKRPEQGVGVCVSRDVTGECQYCRLPGDKCCRGGFCEEVERLLSCSDGGAKLTQRWSHGILIRGEALLLGGALPQQPEHCQLPAGDGTTVVECHGVLYRPQQSLNHRGHSHVHQKAASRGRAAGGRRIQCGPGQARGSACSDNIEATLSTTGLEDMIAHLLPI